MREIICQNMCRYHKPGKKEDPGCGGVEWLATRRHLYGPLAELVYHPGEPLFGLAPGDPRLLTVCRSCEFRVDGCDFRDPEVPDADCEPCGGLKAVAGLLRAGQDLDL